MSAERGEEQGGDPGVAVPAADPEPPTPSTAPTPEPPVSAPEPPASAPVPSAAPHHPPAGAAETAGPALVHPVDDADVAPTSVPATSPFGITVPVPIVSDRELGLSRPGAHAAGAPPRAGTLLSGVLGEAPSEASAPPQPVTTPLRAILLWSGIAVLLIAALLSTIGALNRGIYSASGFVGSYLRALEAQDADVALAFPGVRPGDGPVPGLPADAADTLLRGSVLRAPTDPRLVSDTSDGRGRHTVVYSVSIGGERHEVSFDVERDGSWAGVFDSWRFATSPLAAVTVTVLHDTTFTVNGLTLDARAHSAPDAEPTFDNTASYLVLSPGLYEFSRTSVLLAAAPDPVVVLTPESLEVMVDVQPTEAFVGQVQTEINGFLDRCTKQHVLQPTGCPFGTAIDDRVIGEPTWSIVAFPVVTLVPGDGAFEMPSTEGTAHISVLVQSLFDGEESTIERDEPYTMGATVTIAPDGNLNIQLH